MATVTYDATLIDPNPPAEVTFKRALELFPKREFPTLRRAVRNQQVLRNTQLWWLDKQEKAQHNYAMIFRQAFGWTNMQGTLMTAEEAQSSQFLALHQMLSMVEWQCAHGVRGTRKGKTESVDDPGTFYEWKTHSMGGVRHYLGRGQRRWDQVELYVLRDLFLRTNVQMSGEDAVKHEWLAEVSLLVKPNK